MRAMNHNIGMLIARLNERSHRWLARELARAGLAGLAPSHGDVLALLFQKGEAAMHEIAEFAHRTRPTMTVLVDKLAAQGLVVRERSAVDTRRVIVRLTESGEALRAAFKSISRRYLATFYDGLAPDEAETLERLLEKVLANQEKQKGKTR